MITFQAYLSNVITKINEIVDDINLQSSEIFGNYAKSQQPNEFSCDDGNQETYSDGGCPDIYFAEAAGESYQLYGTECGK